MTNSHTLLRLALPFDQANLREIDAALTAAELDLKRGRSLASSKGNVQKAHRSLERQGETILNAVPPAKRQQAASHLAALQADIERLETQLGDRQKEAAATGIDTALTDLERLEGDYLTAFPFQIPDTYRSLPRLLGRAQVELETTVGTMALTLDGYSAPLTAGNFADLVRKGFYDGLEFGRVEDDYVVQVGDPPGSADGFVDPATGKLRTIPLELRPAGESTLLYGQTFEEAGMWDTNPALPFSAKGTLAMARYADDANSASSQFFVFMAEPDLTPAGLNLLDGRYATFGYVTQGVEVLDKIRKGDRIVKARIVSGSENLQG